MASNECSFDCVSKIDFAEVDNAVQNALKEIVTRFDFKGADARIAREKEEIVVSAGEAAKVTAAIDVLQTKLVRRNVPLRNFEYGPVEEALGGAARQKIKIKNGIPIETAKEIVKFVKEMKIKVQGSIQADQVRFAGKSRDDLQAVIAALRKNEWPVELQFVNYR